MLPFAIRLTSGESPYRQIVYAATRAVVSGDLLPGAPFPSVRVLSQSLKINPNTAQKAIAELVRDGMLEVKPGIGTVVAEWGPATAAERAALLSDEVERLVVEARRLGVSCHDLVRATEGRWVELFGEDVAVDSTRDASGASSRDPGVERSA